MAKPFTPKQHSHPAPVKAVGAPGFIIMESLEMCSGVSWDGVRYEVKGGLVEVPVQAVTALQSHGFRVKE